MELGFGINLIDKNRSNSQIVKGRLDYTVLLGGKRLNFIAE